MGSFANYLENALLNHVFGTGEGRDSEYATTKKFIALVDTAIVDSDSGGDLSEPTGSQYARVVCHTWLISTAGATENSGDITFAQATQDYFTGRVLDFAIVDTSTLGTGNVMAYGSLTISKSVQSGDTPKFAAGDLDITLS